MSTSKKAAKEIHALANPKKAAFAQRFFKTGKGEYSEGDRFLGLTVPLVREIAGRYRALPLSEISELLKSSFHEIRLLGLIILTNQYPKSSGPEKARIYRFYLKSKSAVNNWDLVDTSAAQIVGVHLKTRDRAILYKLVHSKNLWDRRIAIISTFTFIRAGDFADTLKISEILLSDEEDLMHKAVGWMLREVGKRDVAVLKRFLNKHAKHMPRTMLRYAIEKFPENERRRYLSR